MPVYWVTSSLCRLTRITCLGQCVAMKPLLPVRGKCLLEQFPRSQHRALFSGPLGVCPLTLCQCSSGWGSHRGTEISGLQELTVWDFLGGPGIKTYLPGRVCGFDPGQGAKIPHSPWPK